MAGSSMLCLCLTVAVACVPPSLAAQEPKPASSGTPPRSDFIEFITISPPTDTPLDRGKAVALEVSVEYELVSKGTAFIRVIVQDASRRPVAQFKASKVVKGQSMYKCAGTVKIPKKGAAIHLVAELYELVQLMEDFDIPEGDELLQKTLKARVPRSIAFAEVRFETREGLSKARQ